MRRGRKPVKAKDAATLPVDGRSRKNKGSRERELETRLAEALEQLQTRDRDLTEALEQQTATAEILRVISENGLLIRDARSGLYDPLPGVR